MLDLVFQVTVRRMRTKRGGLAAICALVVLAIFPGHAFSLDTGEPLRQMTAAAWTGDFDGMVERRLIRVLIPFSRTAFYPYTLKNGQTEMRGATVTLLSGFEKLVNENIKNKSKRIFIFPIPTPRGQIFEDLASGKGDIAIANLTITPERQEKVAFSDPMLTDVREFIVTRTGVAEIETLEQLSGKELHVRRSSSFYASLERVNGELVAKGLAPIDVKTVDDQVENEDILEMIEAEFIPATALDNHTFQMWKHVFPNIVAHERVPLRLEGQIGWAFRKDSPKLQEVVNRYIAQSRKGTERGNILYADYVKTGKGLKNAFDGDAVGRLKGLMSLFRKYGEKYDIDPFIIAAVAFQESRFDQKMVMSSGATGIMQMMKSTASDPNVNLPNVENLEENVHGFARYMRYMRDQYIKQPDMSEADRLMLLLASYNAGPVRIKNLRAKASNPNVWHEHVEWEVWKAVGFETVQYVRNVHRYYIAFKGMMEGRAASRKVVEEIKPR